MFRAYEPAGASPDRLVAVKVFRLDLTPDQAAALVVELNALVAADIAHPNIAAPVAAGLEHGTPYLVQEYVVGDSLDVVLRERGPMPVEQVVALVASMAGAIDHAAGRGVHHGALHLRDVLMAAEGARVTGFGIAAALSKIGVRLPTRPQYSSPDGPSDVYSLGAIAFEAATGKRVSPDNLADFEIRHGVELRSAFGVALAVNPDMRPEHAGDFAAVLWDAAEMTAEAERNSGALGTAPAALDPGPPGLAAHATEPVVDFDLDVGPPAQPDDLMGPGDEIPPPDVPPSRLQASWSPPLPDVPLPEVIPVQPASRRWPIVAMLLVFAVLAALSVGLFLRSPARDADGGPAGGVDETTVDLPVNAPPAAPAEPPAARAERTPPAPSKPMPAPVPSRAASGALRAATGRLLIRSTPADADVTVNGRARGKTPLALRDLEIGSYTIRVTRDGYAPEERTVQLTSRRPSQSTTIDLRSTATPAASRKIGPGGLTVRSRPAGARVFVNGRLAGSTPVAIPDLPAGSATVRIEMDGYRPWITTVSVNAGDETTVGASLERQ